MTSQKNSMEKRRSSGEADDVKAEVQKSEARKRRRRELEQQRRERERDVRAEKEAWKTRVAQHAEERDAFNAAMEDKIDQITTWLKQPHECPSEDALLDLYDECAMTPEFEERAPCWLCPHKYRSDYERKPCVVCGHDYYESDYCTHDCHLCARFRSADRGWSVPSYARIVAFRRKKAAERAAYVLK